MSSTGPVNASELLDLENAAENLYQWTSHILYNDKNGDTGKKIFAMVERLELTGGLWDEMLPNIFKEIFSRPAADWNWGLIFVTFATARAVDVGSKRKLPNLHILSILLCFVTSHLKSWIAAHGGWCAIPQFVVGL
jgi:hypothetical protein